MPAQRGGEEGPGALGGQLGWLASILMGEGAPDVSASVVAGGGQGLVVVPTAGNRRLILPPGRLVAAAALRNHAAMRSPSAHTVRTGLAAALALGLPQLVFRDRLVFRSANRAVPPPLIDHLRTAMDAPSMEVAVVLGPPAPNRKPVLQLLSPSGEPIGFAKVGWNGFTRALVDNEAATLASLPPGGLPSVSTPRVLHHGRWRGLEMLVTSPLPPRVRRFGESAPPLGAASEVAAAGGTSVMPLASSAYWGELRSRRAAPDRVAEDLGSVLDSIEARFGAVELTFGAWHGDWAPWNLALERGRLWAIDWEHARRDVPIGLDAVHFRFQVELLRRRRPIGQAADLAAEAAETDLRQLGLTDDVRRVLPIVHLLEIWLRAEDARRLEAGVNPRIYPVIVEEIRRRTRSLGA